MDKNNLIVYMSDTGNTEMIAKEIAKNFEKYGWNFLWKT
ncbi:MAG: flavodoxin family protein [Deltaproteobacteria bacterium]|nr:flavodoxin family protein [Deltaproteobacteria bacterium]